MATWTSKSQERHEGVTAVQMDVKVEGVPLERARGSIRASKESAHADPRSHHQRNRRTPRLTSRPRAPKILTTKVKVDQIGLVIGPGGKTINGISERTKADDITIEDDGSVFITGKNGAAEAALKEIVDLTRELRWWASASKALSCA